MKLLAILSALFITSTIQAQVSQGTILLGGGIGGNIPKKITDPSFDQGKAGNIYISAGMALARNQVLGLRLGYSGSSSNNPNAGGAKGRGYQAGIFFRQYAPLATRFSIFGEAGALYLRNKLTSGNPGFIEQTTRQGAAMAGFGIAFQATRRIQLELMLPSLISVSQTRTEQRYDFGSGPVEMNQRGWDVNAGASSLQNLALGIQLTF